MQPQPDDFQEERTPRIAAFSITIFLSAFLLFQIQPLISRYILPWFGGTPAVWTTALLFFQSLLLAGYAFAHWLSSQTKKQLRVFPDPSDQPKYGSAPYK